MTLADYTQAVIAVSRERREVPLVEAALTPGRRTTISTARLMSVAPGDCELLVNGEFVPWREGGR